MGVYRLGGMPVDENPVDRLPNQPRPDGGIPLIVLSQKRAEPAGTDFPGVYFGTGQRVIRPKRYIDQQSIPSADLPVRRIADARRQ